MYAGMIQLLSSADDRLDPLRGLDVRTLVVVGEEDEGFLGPSERLAAAIPGAVLEVIADAGHSPQEDRPDEWLRVVRAHLARVSS